MNAWLVFLLQGSIIEHMPKICEAINMLSGRLKRFPTYDEIAEVINVKPSVVRLALESTRSPISLDKTINCMSIQVHTTHPYTCQFCSIHCIGRSHFSFYPAGHNSGA